MLVEEMSHETFLPRLHQEFSLETSEAGTLSLCLTEVKAHGVPPPNVGYTVKRRPFSLLFLGPCDPVLPQRIYPMSHPVLGAFELFIVPVGRDERGVRYEAVFS